MPGGGYCSGGVSGSGWHDEEAGMRTLNSNPKSKTQLKVVERWWESEADEMGTEGHLGHSRS